MPKSRSRRHPPVAALLLGAALALGACRDAPTGPRLVRQDAGGEDWVAMTRPDGLPSLDTWLPYLGGRERRGGVAETVLALRRDAEAHRAGRRYEVAAELTREATRLAAASLERAPEAPVLLTALSALRLWGERVALEVPLERHPALGASLRAVEASRAAAESALAAGDTLAAVRHLAEAAERVEAHAPAAVVVQVIQRAERRLAAGEIGPFPRERAEHLLGTARQELYLGDDVRALRRALYALQIAEGNGVAGPADDCLSEGCDPVEASR